MHISAFANYVNPVIKSLKKLGGSAQPSEVCAHIAEDLGLDDETLDERLKNGVSRFENQVHWARFYLAKTGYIDSSKRGVWTLTDKGMHVEELSEDDLKNIVKEVQRINYANKQIKEENNKPETGIEPEDDSLPEHRESNYQEELLGILKKLSPNGFERICQRLLREAGFEKVVVTGKTGDGGIDGNGVLQLNAFVSFQVLFQCKRYEGNVGSSQVRDFRGAMLGRAEKGIIMTTGGFTADAKREANRDGVPPIELVDGEKLVEMFETYELGLKPRKTFDVDHAFFDSYKD